MTAFPSVYLLCALGCSIVWSVDLLNMGNSGKLMAVASAARPDCTSRPCKGL
jgi:zinc transporter 1/2/3